MNKKIFLIGILLVLGVSIVAVSAAPLNFNTPDGFEIKKDLGLENREVSFMGLDAKQNVTIMQKDDQQINVTTYETVKEADLTLDGSKNLAEKNIGGKQGYMDNNDGKVKFMYKNPDTKGIFVEITAPSEELVQAVLK